MNASYRLSWFLSMILPQQQGRFFCVGREPGIGLEFRGRRDKNDKGAVILIVILVFKIIDYLR